MQLNMLAKDSASGRSGCPAVYVGDQIDTTEDHWAIVQAPEIDDPTSENVVNWLPGEVGNRIKMSVLEAAVDAYRASKGQ